MMLTVQCKFHGGGLNPPSDTYPPELTNDPFFPFDYWLRRLDGYLNLVERQAVSTCTRELQLSVRIRLFHDKVGIPPAYTFPTCPQLGHLAFAELSSPPLSVNPFFFRQSPWNQSPHWVQ
jgi:hypothetical protein